MATGNERAASGRGAGGRITLLSLWLALLGAAGVALADRSGVPLGDRFDVPWLLLAPVILVVSRVRIDFEYRNESRSLVLTQLPLAFGVVFLPAWQVVVSYVLATLVDSAVLRRQDPVKLLFNLGVAAMEAGLTAAGASLAAPASSPGPLLWAGLLVGLFVAEVIGMLAMSAVMHWVHADVRDHLLAPLASAVATTLALWGVAVVALTAVWTEPLAGIVIALLVGAMTLAYRAYRRLHAQQQTTAELFEFVKNLGPVDIEEPGSLAVLEQVRGLLHTRYLDLALADGGGWRHFAAWTGDAPEATEAGLSELVDRVADSQTPALFGRAPGSAAHMATPLRGASAVMGILTVSGRLGDSRAFDMGDLRLLEAVAAELATALERGRLLRDLGRAATTDALTGLPNLAETTRLLNAMLEHTGHRVSVAVAAVDSFREVNDTLGHQVGDDMLLEVTRRLGDPFPGALVGRIGGGRFAVAIPHSGDDDPSLFGLRLRTRVEGTAQLGGIGAHVRLSIGCARTPEHGRDAATLLRRAETAAYSARHAHGGPVVWEPAYEVRGQRRLALVAALREALITGAVGVAFQPKLETRNGRVTGVETLARWTHPALGSISPEEFVPLAEASGLIGALTSTVLRQATTACQGWQRRGGRVGVAVNVSAGTLLDPGFVTEVAAVLASSGLPADLLTLELTEGVVLEDPALAAERMLELRALGLRLSVDDFGTGYSSLTYLKGLPVDEVKIDKGFVAGLTHDRADQAVVRAVVDIAHAMAMTVVAEGVEQEEQHALLLALGVDEVQGYLHARPMPMLDMAAWLRNRERSSAS
jgi:diguanylate cyclase (GGDEF)-like protein